MLIQVQLKMTVRVKNVVLIISGGVLMNVKFLIEILLRQQMVQSSGSNKYAWIVILNAKLVYSQTMTRAQVDTRIDVQRAQKDLILSFTQH